jgi:ubiquinone/menaquinone biosynthesis C-methylase UbiE
MKELEKKSIKEFDKWAKGYDSSSGKFFFVRANMSLTKYIGNEERANLLDIGCGTGILFEQLLAKKNLKLYGIDISPKMVKIAQEKFRGLSKVKIKLGSVSHLQYKSNTFNYVTCSNSFHHYPDSNKSLQEMVRVLKRKGKLIILDGYLDGSFSNLFWKIENTLNKEGKVFRYTKDEMKKLFEEAGLKNIRQAVAQHVNLITVGTKS